jgi:hypothetical protein
MRPIARVLAVTLALQGTGALAQGVAPGGPIYNSTGIGSGTGGVIGGTGPTWPNGTGQAPQPSPQTVPPGGYPTTTPSPTYSPSPSPSPRGSAPYASSSMRQPATVPLTLPSQPRDLAFLKGCWRTDVFPHCGHRGTTTWCFDDRGRGRYLYARTDQVNYFCHAQAEATYRAGQLRLQTLTARCEDGSADVPAMLMCREGTDGALCTGDAAQSWTVRLYRVR